MAVSLLPISNTLTDIIYESGWEAFEDTQYTSGSPFNLTDGVKYDMPNNSGVNITGQGPRDRSPIYKDGKIRGVNGDSINILMEFKAVPLSIASNIRVTAAVDISGSVGELYERDFTLTKGNGVIHNIVSSFGAYQLDTWEANGGTVKINSTNSDVAIYDIRYVLARLHKART